METGLLRLNPDVIDEMKMEILIAATDNSMDSQVDCYTDPTKLKEYWEKCRERKQVILKKQRMITEKLMEWIDNTMCECPFECPDDCVREVKP